MIKPSCTPMLLAVFLLSLAANAGAQSCTDCHPDLAQAANVHAAVAMGCEACHTAIDASDIPHKKRNAVAKGLSAEQPDLCYGCHDQAQFMKQTVHAALFMGCTGCHDPHGSENRKLLQTTMPDLCFTCHDKAAFTKRVVHSPVASGDCITCHSPHSSDAPKLLASPVPGLCVMCHDAMASGRHVLAGFGLGSHPVAGAGDPSRPGRELSCASCHQPHSSVSAFLFVEPGSGLSNICLLCHSTITVR